MVVRVVVVAVVLASGCYPASTPMIDPFRGAVGVVMKSQEEIDRRANEDANARAEAQRQHENAQIRETGESLQTPGGQREVDPTRPANLTPAMIKTGIDEIRAAVMACRSGTLRGQVLVAVTVSSEGMVDRVEVIATPDAGLGGCVTTNTQQATFPKTQRGGRFRYPFFF